MTNNSIHLYALVYEKNYSQGSELMLVNAQ